MHKYLNCDNGSTIAYHKIEGANPNIVFLGGYMSNMDGTKAVALQTHCENRGRSYLRFDYSGHGHSSGNFLDGTIRKWSDDTLRVIDQLTDGPLILVGSSMGGWIMMMVALARPERVSGLIGVAAAPDFTELLMWQRFTPDIKKTLLHDKVYYQPTEYADEPYPITLRLIEDARKNLLLQKPVPIRCPLHLIHGIEDDEVPWEHAIKVAKAFQTNDVTLTFIKDGDHRLSRERDLEKIFAAVDQMSG